MCEITFLPIQIGQGEKLGVTGVKLRWVALGGLNFILFSYPIWVDDLHPHSQTMTLDSVLSTLHFTFLICNFWIITDYT